MASDGGKGSAPRPFSVDQDQFADNWDRIFGSKKKAQSVAETATKQDSVHVAEVGEEKK